MPLILCAYIISPFFLFTLLFVWPVVDFWLTLHCYCYCYMAMAAIFLHIISMFLLPLLRWCFIFVFFPRLSLFCMNFFWNKILNLKRSHLRYMNDERKCSSHFFALFSLFGCCCFWHIATIFLNFKTCQMDFCVSFSRSYHTHTHTHIFTECCAFDHKTPNLRVQQQQQQQ